MSQLLRIASIQLDVAPAPTIERLKRAGTWIEQAGRQGARLIVLPELFNTGYCYHDENYLRAEPTGGQTSGWLKETAARLKVHLAGSWLVRDGQDIYNRLTLAAPDGRTWQYEKNYPWAWERAYFRGQRRISVANTDLGRIGMLMCWDVAHPDLWRQYAGQVDLMVIVSCPPNATRPTYHLPDGKDMTFNDLGQAMRSLKDDGQKVFMEGLQKQAAWLGVPCVNSSACGEFMSKLPDPKGSLLLLVPFAPWLVKYLGRANEIRMQCGMISAARILAGDGRVLVQASANQGEGIIWADVELSTQVPIPSTKNPGRPVAWLSYFIADLAVTWLMTRQYQRGKLLSNLKNR